MTRVHHRAPATQSSRPFNKVAATRKKKPYKILLESVTTAKKKLNSAISYDAHAPTGYSFVPAGTPDLTEFCKEICRKRGLIAHIVSAKPKNRVHVNPEKIGHHVHRIGHHFPNEVVDQACDWLGYSFRNGTYQKNLDTLATSRLARSLATHGGRMGLHDRPGTVQETREQIRAAIRDLFPKIPDGDLEAIVKHAFREGTKRVGNAKDVPLARRVQLAVVAHIRHGHTNYDQLLKTGSWQEARAAVEQASLDQLIKWRGEGPTGITEMEDTFREVIVLDDDDEDEESEDAESSIDGREHSLEIVSSQATTHELQANDHVEAEWIDAHSTHRVPGMTYFLRRAPRQVPVTQRQTRNTYQTAPPPLKAVVDRRTDATHAPPPYSQLHSRQVLQSHQPDPRLERIREPNFERGRQLMAHYPRTPAVAASNAAPPQHFYDSNGTLFKLQPLTENHGTRTNHSSVRSNAVECIPATHFIQTGTRPNPASHYAHRDAGPLTRLMTLKENIPLHDRQPTRHLRSIEHPVGEDEVVVPSIERDTIELDALPPIRNLNITQSRADQMNASAPSDLYSGQIFPGSTTIGNTTVPPSAQCYTTAEAQQPQRLKRKSWHSPRHDAVNEAEVALSKRQRPAQGNYILHESPRDASVGIPSRHVQYMMQSTGGVQGQNTETRKVIDLTSSPLGPNERRPDAFFTSSSLIQSALPGNRNHPYTRSVQTELNDRGDPYREKGMPGTFPLPDNNEDYFLVSDRPPSVPRMDDRIPKTHAPSTSISRNQPSRENVVVIDSPEKIYTRVTYPDSQQFHRRASGDRQTLVEHSYSQARLHESPRIRRYGLPQDYQSIHSPTMGMVDGNSRIVQQEPRRQLFEYY